MNGTASPPTSIMVHRGQQSSKPTPSSVVIASTASVYDIDGSDKLCSMATESSHASGIAPGTATARRLADRVHARVLSDSWFADQAAELERLAEWRDDTAGAPVPHVPTQTLRTLNDRLRAEQAAEAQRTAVDTAAVVESVRSLNSRAAVHARVERGRLLAFKAADGRTNLYPRWQFDPQTGDTVPVAAELAAVCRDRFDGDVVAFDLMVRTPLDRLGGASVVSLLADRRWPDAVDAATHPAEQAG